MYTDEELKEGTLKWCNEIRAETNKEPITELPKGKLGDPKTCPCGTATGTLVNLVTFRYHPDDNAKPLPQVVIDFVNRFDGGYFPELVI